MWTLEWRVLVKDPFCTTNSTFTGPTDNINMDGAYFVLVRVTAFGVVWQDTPFTAHLARNGWIFSKSYIPWTLVACRVFVTTWSNAALHLPVSRNGLLLCFQFAFTTLNNSLLFLVALRELSRELRVINYNFGELSAWQTNHSGERGLAVAHWRLISTGVPTEENKDYCPLFPCTSEIITRNSVKVYGLALLIWKCKSTKPKKKSHVLSGIFKQLTQSEIRFISGKLPRFIPTEKKSTLPL